MRTNMWVRIVCFTLTVVALLGSVFFYYFCKNDFGFNICLAVFGSALLTYINAWISYKLLRRKAIMRYLTDLRRYRQKFKCLQAAARDDQKRYLEDISDFFYELHSDYSQIQHIWKDCPTHRTLSSDLSLSFQNIVDVQSELNTACLNLAQQKAKVDESADMVEAIAKRKKYLHPVKEGQ